MLRRSVFVGVTDAPVPRGGAQRHKNILGPLRTPKRFDLVTKFSMMTRGE